MDPWFGRFTDITGSFNSANGPIILPPGLTNIGNQMTTPKNPRKSLIHIDLVVGGWSYWSAPLLYRGPTNTKRPTEPSSAVPLI